MIMKDDAISRQAAIDVFGDIHPLDYNAQTYKARIEKLPSARTEPLTDKEQRIFLAAMVREENICKQVDNQFRNCQEPYEDSLVRVCQEIIRKVKGALWIH